MTNIKSILDLRLAIKNATETEIWNETSHMTWDETIKVTKVISGSATFNALNLEMVKL
jgi:hypothetical protein